MGVIIDPRGTTEACFAWGLGITSNNKAEAYALWQGLNIAKGIGMQSIKVIRDSRMIINHMVKKTLPRDNLLASILDQSRQIGGFLLLYKILSCSSRTQQRSRSVGKSKIKSKGGGAYG
jgi:ribonuclease HI